MLVDVKDLTIEFQTLRGRIRAVDRLSFSIREGETLGIVGESGCGKSLTSLALMGLLPNTAEVTAQTLTFNGQNLLKISENEKRHIRGSEMAMIFQDPMTSLNPAFTVGFQIKEVLQAHQNIGKNELQQKARELLAMVGIPDPDSRLNSYPHQLSGGMSQRVMIAIAVACQPKLLIADEPTTALDVTIQAQILDLLRSLQKKHKMALMLITHDIGVVSEMADRILVMYAGQKVEEGPARLVIEDPQHPYTRGLLACLPGMHEDSEHRARLPSIPGLVPDLTKRPSGCQLHPRCELATDICRQSEPNFKTVGERGYKCIL